MSVNLWKNTLEISDKQQNLQYFINNMIIFYIINLIFSGDENWLKYLFVNSNHSENTALLLYYIMDKIG